MSALQKSLALAVILGCAAPTQPTVTRDAAADTSAPPVALITTGDIFVARGQVVKTSFDVSCCTLVTVDLIDLPPGVTATRIDSVLERRKAQRCVRRVRFFCVFVARGNHDGTARLRWNRASLRHRGPKPCTLARLTLRLNS